MNESGHVGIKSDDLEHLAEAEREKENAENIVVGQDCGIM